MLWENASESGGLHRIPHPEPRPARRLRIFELFPILLAIAFNWIIAIIVTESGHYDNSDATTQASHEESIVLSQPAWLDRWLNNQQGERCLHAFHTCISGAVCSMPGCHMDCCTTLCSWTILWTWPHRSPS